MFQRIGITCFKGLKFDGFKEIKIHDQTKFKKEILMMEIWFVEISVIKVN